MFFFVLFAKISADMSYFNTQKEFSLRDLLYRALIFIGTVGIIVYFLPRDGKFNYQFDIDKPWKYGQLMATFDFPIYKADEVVKREQDSILAAFVGAMVCFMQRQVQPVFRNAAFFQVLVGFVSGSFIWFVWRQVPALDVDKISIGVIMLLIPGAALTNAVRDMLVGHTVSGLLRMFESLLLALMLAIGFGSAIYLFGV